jgi:hypothetical protein
MRRGRGEEDGGRMEVGCGWDGGEEGRDGAGGGSTFLLQGTNESESDSSCADGGVQ